MAESKKHEQNVVLATSNQGKLRELTALLQPAGWTVRAQNEWQFADAEETGLTFVENAIIKARHACKHTGLPALADDSGLAVDVLDGAPGIYSSRYAGPGATDASNVDKLLDALKNCPQEKRTARFICVLVLMKHAADPTPIICQGEWHGYITEASAGTGGFGYDPVFYVPEHGCTAAELALADKQKISHRGQALAKLQKRLAR